MYIVSLIYSQWVPASMPDTRYSLYSEYDQAVQRLQEEGDVLIKRIQDLSQILTAPPTDSSFEDALHSMYKIVGQPSPKTVYAYTDEEGNDMNTTLGGGNRVPTMALVALRILGLDPPTEVMEQYKKIS